MNVKKALTDFTLTEKRGSAIENTVSLFSQMYHFVAFDLWKPRKKTRFDTAMLIISVDVDAGNKRLGLINGGKNDANVHKCFSEVCIGEIEERALPRFVKTFNEFEVPVTFAIRGQLTETADPLMKILLNSPVKHDIGAHGYSHRNFQTLKRKEAETELNMISLGLKKFGITPKSFVFPGNRVAHLDLLKKFGYKCYREYANFLTDDMYIEKKWELYNIQPSLYLNQSISPIIMKKIVDVAAAKKTPLHLWFHTWNFGETDEKINRYVNEFFAPFLKHAKSKEKRGLLTFETMLSAAKKADAILDTE